MGCLEANTVIAFVDGRLPSDAASVAQQHLADCQSCADLVAAAADERPPAAAAAGFAQGAAIGRYVILHLIGHGGMGDVYAAYDPQLDRKVALKLLHGVAPAGVSVAQARARLLREAKAIARLSHGNVVVVHDAGEIDSRVFLAMEFVDGQTLAAWLEAAPRSWREIRDVFVAAGRGLAAAHAAGLVHRDFKPQNVMVARDGTVRVMDFGLASDAGGGEAGDAAPGAAAVGAAAERASAMHAAAPTLRVAALTRTGTLMGTPLYMSPEQFLARGTDPRTDQFSFCVALYHALYGERPFPADSFPALVDAVVAGRIREPASRARVPAFLRKIIWRGLRPDPDERFPSMAALLEALRQDPAQRRRRVAIGAVAAGLALVAAVGGQRLATRGQRLCLGASDKLAGAWQPAEQGARRSAVHSAFLDTGRSFAGETWTRVSSLLDDYARRWAAMYTDACQATHARGDQSADVLDLRMTCLEGRRGALRALTDVLARADGTVLAQSVNAVQALPDIDRCANLPLLRAQVTPPSDAATRARVDELRAGLAEVKALTDTGQWKQGRAKVDPLLAAAQSTGYPAVVAEAFEARGQLEYNLGDVPAAAKSIEEAVWTALSARQDDAAVRCAAMLVGMSGYLLGRPEDAERWDRLAQSLLPRLGAGRELAQAWLLHDRGVNLERRDDWQGAARELRAALALKRKVLPPDHPDLAVTLEGVAVAEMELGDHAGALAAIDESLKTYERAFGRDNPLLGRPLGNRGEILERLGRHAEAEADLRASTERWTGYVGPDHVWVAYPLTALGKTLLADVRAGEAIVPLERALRIRERAEPNAELVAETRFALARALWEAARDRARARALAEAARDGYRKLPTFAKRATEVEAWIAQHASTAAR